MCLLLQRFCKADLNVIKGSKPTNIILMHVGKYCVIIKKQLSKKTDMIFEKTKKMCISVRG